MKKGILVGTAVALCTAGWGMSAQPIDVGENLQLPWDDSLVDVERTDAPALLHAPEFRGTVMTFDAPWEGDGVGTGTIIEDNGLYRLYYLAWQMDHAPESKWKQKGYRICYAESRDGINWTRPDLGIAEFEGSKHNNLLFGTNDLVTGSIGFFRDTNPSCPPDERYKMIAVWCKPGDTDSSQTPFYAFYSGDGIHFRPGSKIYDRIKKEDNRREKDVLLEYDTHNCAFWDAPRGVYRIYTRGWHPIDRTKRRYDGRFWAADQIRDIRQFSSASFSGWQYPEEVSFGEGAEDCEMYTNEAIPYFRAPDVILGFPTRYTERREWNRDVEKLPNRDYRAYRMHKGEQWNYRYGLAVTDGLFMMSRDGKTFKRWNEAFLRPGPERRTNWVYGDCYAFNGLVVTPSPLGGADEISIYYPEGHWSGDATRLHRYAVRLDGFVSRHAPYETKRLVTKELVFAGNSLHVNFATAARGFVRAVIRDDAGAELASLPAFGDSVDRILTFPSDADLGAFAGKPVTVTFELCDADLYSFRFAAEPMEKPSFVRGKLADCDRYVSLNPNFKKAFAFLKRPDLKGLAPGRYEIDGDSCWANVIETELRDFMATNAMAEVHRKYVDIQMPLDGDEGIGVAELTESELRRLPYDESADAAVFFHPVGVERFRPGEFAIFFPPCGAHMPCLSVPDVAPVGTKRKKVVVKVISR